jgi:hypothetical protein
VAAASRWFTLAPPPREEGPNEEAPMEEGPNEEASMEEASR